MTDRACQACHQQTYHSFATDHPGFADWPYQRRTPIAFDHGSHQSKHFVEKKHTFECRTCHVEDPSRDVQLLVNYQAACAACHDEKIAASVTQGVPMFALPTLDVSALRAAGHDIGPWPPAATGDFDGRLPPVMKLLLAGDPAAARAMAVLGPDFDFFDVDATNREHLAACADLAGAIKRLMQELTEAGPETAERRMASINKPPQKEAATLLRGLSTDTLRLVATAWLGPTATSSNGNSRPAASTTGAWFYDTAKLAIRYRPTGHADAVLTAWLDAAVSAAGENGSQVAIAMLEELAKATAPGLCATCHSMDQSPSGQITIHWQPTDRTAAPRGFTKFSHGPHVLLPGLADCSACHAVNPSANLAKSYTSWDETAFVSDFHPMAKQDCAKCHTRQAAGDSCQKCHNYHVAVESLVLRVETQKSTPMSSNPQLSTLNPQPFKTSTDTPPERR
jgi:hypothetical protein